ncbi:MAG: hypothetical protein HFH18_07700 [Ruminococcus sp.]|nr:hypothetical protein [Ruminococcus sp.]
MRNSSYSGASLFFLNYITEIRTIKAFSGSYPNTDLAVTCTSSAEAYSMIEACSIDLALVVKPENAGAAVYHSLGMIDYTFVCTPAYREKLNCKNDEIFEYRNIMLPNPAPGNRIFVQ